MTSVPRAAEWLQCGTKKMDKSQVKTHTKRNVVGSGGKSNVISHVFERLSDQSVQKPALTRRRERGREIMGAREREDRNDPKKERIKMYKKTG